MKEYYNKHLDFKFYTTIGWEDDGTYRFWICDSNKRICDYFSSDMILDLAQERNLDEEEMQEIIAQDLAKTTDFNLFISSFCTIFDTTTKQDIDIILTLIGVEEDYKGLTIEEKVEKWYKEDDFSNIFGNYLVQLY